MGESTLEVVAELHFEAPAGLPEPHLLAVQEAALAYGLAMPFNGAFTQSLGLGQGFVADPGKRVVAWAPDVVEDEVEGGFDCGRQRGLVHPSLA
jgi:hypothetical protein